MTRPEGVPAEARYIEEEEGWAAGETAEGGKKIGTWRYWRPDGTFCEESEWHDGKLHGTHRRFHDDGSLAALAEWEHGRRRLVTVHRADGPSQETTMDQLPESIQVMVQEFDDEGYFVRQRFRTADGDEVDLDGKPFPPRPANVPEGAEYFSRYGHWTIGRYIAGAELKQVGLRRFWAKDGAFRQAEYHSADGRQLAEVSLSGVGNPLIEAARAGDEQGVADCLALGLGASPGVVLHAAYEGLPDLARRLPQEGEFTDPRTEPERPEGVPEDAVWVAGMVAWVSGELDDFTPVGTWRMWENRPYMDDSVWPAETDFADGRRTWRREYLRPGRIYKEHGYGPDGEITTRRSYDDGVLEKEKEHLPDGALVDRRFHSTGALRTERIERDGELVSETWHAEDGRLIARVEPCDKLVKGKPVEWWRGLDGAGEVVAEGPVRPGPHGQPVGKWRLADGETVKFTKLDARRHGELADLAVALRAWREMPDPPALAGVEDVPWKRLETFFSTAKNFPFLLKGLASGEEPAVQQALGQIWDEVLHQHTISEAAGPAARYMVALAQSLEQVPDGLLELLLRIATRDGSLDATRQLKRLYDSVPAGKKPAKYFVKHGVEGEYHEVYRCLAEAVPTWARLARDPDASVKARQCAIHLLGAAPGEEAGAALRDLLAAGPGRLTTAEVLLCLGLHPGAGSDACVAAYLSDDDPLLRFCAALTWVRNGATPAATAVPTLIAAVPGPDELDQFGQLFLAVGNARTDAIGALSLLPPEQTEECLELMCAAIDACGPLDAVEIVRALLDIVFPEEAYQEGAVLTEPQRRVVGAVADSKVAWTFNVNLGEVLRYNGLPTDRDKLRVLREARH